jgi:DeoR/GlpR family transcriptional regulator of sugar metabolism
VINARARREIIAQLVDEHETINITDLIDKFKVTDTSIRHDLSVLEDAGRLRRVRGGAMSRGAGLTNAVYAARARKNQAEKRRIGVVAASLVHAGDVVLFDSGSTATEVAVHVPPALRSTIKVVTAALPIIQEVGRWEQAHLVTLGGLYLAEYQQSVGPPVLNQLRDLRANLLFLGCDGATIEGGLSTPHLLVAEVSSVMASLADKVVLVTDSTKLGRAGFTSFLPIGAVNVLVTDDHADPEFVKRLQSMGIEVLLASEPRVSQPRGG